MIIINTQLTNSIQPLVPTITFVDRNELPPTVTTVGGGVYVDVDGKTYGVLEDMSLNSPVSPITSCSSIAIDRAPVDAWDTKEQPKQSEDSVYLDVADKLDELIAKYKHLKAETPLNEDWKLKTNTYSEIIKDLIEWRSKVI